MIYSSFLGRLTDAQLAGVLNIPPEIISVTSETPNLLDIPLAKQIFNCRISSNWGSMEFGAMGLSSQFEDGHLLSDDMLIIEGVDEHRDAVPPAKKATKLFTTKLYNTTLTLIRYELTDRMTIYQRPAVSGSSLRAASGVESCTEDYFTYQERASGAEINVHAHLFRQALEHTTEITEYQVREASSGVDIAIVQNRESRVDRDNLQGIIASDLEKIGLKGAAVTVDIVPVIERTRAQKLRRFVAI